MARIVGWVNVGLTGLSAAAALAAGLGLAGRSVPVLDLLTHFAPFYAVAGGLGLAWALTLGRGPVVAAAILALLVSGFLLAPEFERFAGPQAAPTAPGAIKVVQFNAARSNRDVDRIVAWLAAQDADVITLTEASRPLKAALARRTGWKTAGGHSHLVIFTPERYAEMVRPKLADKVTFINATYARPEGPMELVTVHFTWPTKPDIAAQVRAAETVAAARPRERMILTGDLNATPWSWQLRRLDRSLGLIRRDRAVATWPARVLGREWPLPVLPIDHVYAGPGWATVKVERGPYLGSDHYPLIVTLAPVAPR